MTHFDENPSWVFLARVDAAGGVMWLAREPDMADSELLENIERLSRDDVPAVSSKLRRVLTTFTTPRQT